jgi:hypothetical protein
MEFQVISAKRLPVIGAGRSHGGSFVRQTAENLITATTS